MHRTGLGVRDTLLFRKNRELYPIKVENIVYMSKKNNITYVHLSDHTQEEFRYVSFKQIIDSEENRWLFMANKSTIVNINYIYILDPTNGFIRLKDNRGTIDMSSSYGNILINTMESFCEIATGRNAFLVRSHSIRYVVDLKDLTYAENSERYLYIYQIDGSCIKLSQKPIRYILSVVNADTFIPCARGRAVNIANISDINWSHCMITLKNGKKIKAGEKYIKNLQEIREKTKEECGIRIGELPKT